MINRLKLILTGAPRLAALQRTRRESGGTGASIRAYTLHLAADRSTVFARTIDNFISCTKESKETRPQVVMRNMRQFMTGMKNYLVTHGEREFERHVEKERNKVSNYFASISSAKVLCRNFYNNCFSKMVLKPLQASRWASRLSHKQLDDTKFHGELLIFRFCNQFFLNIDWLLTYWHLIISVLVESQWIPKPWCDPRRSDA